MQRHRDLVGDAASHAPRGADLGRGRPAGIPAAGLERPVRAEGNAGSRHRQAQRRLAQRGGERGLAEEAGRTRCGPGLGRGARRPTTSRSSSRARSRNSRNCSPTRSKAAYDAGSSLRLGGLLRRALLPKGGERVGKACSRHLHVFRPSLDCARDHDRRARAALSRASIPATPSRRLKPESG